MESRGMEERDRIKGFHYRQVFVGFLLFIASVQHFDAIDRPVRHFLDARSYTRDVEQQESKGHKTRHPDDLAEDLLECYGHNALRQS